MSDDKDQYLVGGGWDNLHLRINPVKAECAHCGADVSVEAENKVRAERDGIIIVCVSCILIAWANNPHATFGGVMHKGAMMKRIH